MNGATYNVLFLCTGNSARSTVAEALIEHWDVPDPAAVTGSEAERRQAFRDAYRQLENRIKLFVALPIDKFDRMAAKSEVDRIGRVEARAVPQ